MRAAFVRACFAVAMVDFREQCYVASMDAASVDCSPGETIAVLQVVRPVDVLPDFV